MVPEKTYVCGRGFSLQNKRAHLWIEVGRLAAKGERCSKGKRKRLHRSTKSNPMHVPHATLPIPACCAGDGQTEPPRQRPAKVCDALPLFWTLFGPYAPDLSRPRGNGPRRQINDFGRWRALRTVSNPLEVLAGAISWRFKSSRPHHLLRNSSA
jgi:hypothetical protein